MSIPPFQMEKIETLDVISHAHDANLRLLTHSSDSKKARTPTFPPASNPTKKTNARRFAPSPQHFWGNHEEAGRLIPRLRKVITDSTRSDKERFHALHQYRNVEFSAKVATEECVELIKLIQRLLEDNAPFRDIDFALAAYKALAEKAPLTQADIKMGLIFFGKIRRDPTVEYGIEIRAIEILRNLKDQQNRK